MFFDCLIISLTARNWMEGVKRIIIPVYNNEESRNVVQQGAYLARLLGVEAKIITVAEYQNLLKILEEIKINLSTRKSEYRLSEKWLTIDETCKVLNISRRTLQSYRDNGIL